MSSSNHRVVNETPGADDVRSGAGTGGGPALSAGVEAALSRRRAPHATVRRQVQRVAVAVLGLFATGLLLPAMTKQWSDRAGELNMKSDLIMRVNEATTDSILASECLARFCLPELAPLRTTGDADIGVDDIDPGLWNDALIAYSRAHNEVPEDWAKSRTMIHGSIQTYFPDSELSRKWDEFSRLVDTYLEVRTLECGDEGNEAVALLRLHLPEIDSTTWSDLTRPDCTQPVEAFEVAYTRLSDSLLARRTELTSAIIDANAAGYSAGLRDFVQDVWPL